MQNIERYEQGCPNNFIKNNNVCYPAENPAEKNICPKGYSFNSKEKRCLSVSVKSYKTVCPANSIQVDKDKKDSSRVLCKEVAQPTCVTDRIEINNLCYIKNNSRPFGCGPGGSLDGAECTVNPISTKPVQCPPNPLTGASLTHDKKMNKCK